MVLERHTVCQSIEAGPGACVLPLLPVLLELLPLLLLPLLLLPLLLLLLPLLLLLLLLVLILVGTMLECYGAQDEEGFQTYQLTDTSVGTFVLFRYPNQTSRRHLYLP